MPDLESCLFFLTVAGLLLGGWGILWARAEEGVGRAWWGRRLFVGTLVSLGASSLVAAIHRAEGLVPLGLLAGSLVVAMLWESPRAPERRAELLTVPEEL